MSSIIGWGLVILDSISVLICWVYVFLLRSFASCGSRSGGTLFPHGLAYGDMEIWIRRHILYSSRIQHAPECGVAFDLVLQSLLPFFRCEGDLSSCFKLAASRRTGSSGSPRAPIAPGRWPDIFWFQLFFLRDENFWWTLILLCKYTERACVHVNVPGYVTSVHATLLASSGPRLLCRLVSPWCVLWWWEPAAVFCWSVDYLLFSRLTSSDWVAVVLHGSQLVLNHPWLALLALFHRRIGRVINFRLRERSTPSFCRGRGSCWLISLGIIPWKHFLSPWTGSRSRLPVVHGSDKLLYTRGL